MSQYRKNCKMRRLKPAKLYYIAILTFCENASSVTKLIIGKNCFFVTLYRAYHFEDK